MTHTPATADHGLLQGSGRKAAKRQGSDQSGPKQQHASQQQLRQHNQRVPKPGDMPNDPPPFPYNMTKKNMTNVIKTSTTDDNVPSEQPHESHTCYGGAAKAALFALVKTPPNENPEIRQMTQPPFPYTMTKKNMTNASTMTTANGRTNHTCYGGCGVLCENLLNENPGVPQTTHPPPIHVNPATTTGPTQ
ncbi:hypothetical protein BS47DRAFT_1361734 [Hydnum rufescens UP504]|uniref:Uncharacterized protein n=1 Tax=Hydnum rufescens UP504 TaxID=1448309 RepID=A0A9P6AZR1_9AGAM|nr:hypothetical protein BS47DRAFT_1361734 [Hydnum rufescens UP504]